ncbi:Uncharacterized protein DBV15_11339 [Temnothorax longispinosus]|uniref:Uncharacterized protein n=1 Tax=Temnothorax longispinosus TaxID=300112 RepID=A0A4S2KIV6_9HYME|nr:Uncharacterized protein DBV15_11339 [Temnothorax longispinosus]
MNDPHIHLHLISMCTREHWIIAIKVKADLRVSALVSCGMYQVFLICPGRRKAEREKKAETGGSWWLEEIYDCHTLRCFIVGENSTLMGLHSPRLAKIKFVGSTPFCEG